MRFGKPRVVDPQRPALQRGRFQGRGAFGRRIGTGQRSQLKAIAGRWKLASPGERDEAAVGGGDRSVRPNARPQQVLASTSLSHSVVSPIFIPSPPPKVFLVSRMLMIADLAMFFFRPLQLEQWIFIGWRLWRVTSTHGTPPRRPVDSVLKKNKINIWRSTSGVPHLKLSCACFESCAATFEEGHRKCTTFWEASKTTSGTRR